MRTHILRFVLAAAAFLPFTASAIYVFNTINYPGAVFTDVRGINNSGQIVGYASLDSVSFFSFSYQSGVFTPLPALPPIPGPPLDVIAHGVNDHGNIVGTLVDTAATAENGIAFFLGGGAYALFARPGWPATYARAINRSRRITGYSFDPVSGSTIGWIYDPPTASYTDIPIPGSVFTIAQGMNDAGQVVGSALVPGSGNMGWLRDVGGGLAFFQIASASTQARGINDLGLVTGFFTVAGATEGFVGSSAGYQTLVAPGADDTFAEAINNNGQVAGLFRYTDAGGDVVTRGFIATPAALPTGTSSSGAYTFLVAVVPDVPIFIDPPVAVGYDYAIGKGDPRIASVRLPIGIGDSRYRVKSRGLKVTLGGGELLDFRAHGFADGVSDFTVSCIETDAMLDPHNPQAFPTELTFVSGGTFSGTMKPIARKHDMSAKQCLED